MYVCNRRTILDSRFLRLLHDELLQLLLVLVRELVDEVGGDAAK